MTLKARVFKLLDKNPLLTAVSICAILQIPYKKHGGTVRNYKREHKLSLKNRQALKCLKFHHTHGWIYVPVSVDRSKAVAAGWRQTKAKNKMLLFVAKEGRLEWFKTGRVNLRIRKPASWGRVKQLLARGFYATFLIDDIELFNKWSETARFKGSHLVYDTGMRLPYACIELLKDGNGVIVKTGDVSDPTAIEIEFCYPDYAEKAEAALEKFAAEMSAVKELVSIVSEALNLSAKQTKQFNDLMKDLTAPKTKSRDNPFNV